MKRTLAAAAFVLAAIPAAAGVYTATKHGSTTTGAQRLGTEPRGDCAQCHDEHASRDGAPTGGPFPYALFAADDNALCATCHAGSAANGIYTGSAAYAGSSHSTGNTIWPGPTPPSRPSSDAGKCVNCHDPHGRSDVSGLIPSMTVAREESLCLPCHDGSPATKNVSAQFSKTYRHPIATAGKHNEAEAGDPTKFAASPTNNRHSECADCHNPHAAASDRFAPTAPSISNRLLGVGRVRVTNGAAGTKPVYTYLGPGDPSPAGEYQICFKCHSSWTTQPGTATDLGVLLNLNNPSFHPVEAQGKNRNINANSFVNGWTWDKLTYCTDCHSSDDATVRGPHGSSWQYILKLSSIASPARRATVMASTELCFACHSYATYANNGSSNTVKGYSRFNPPQLSQGHTYHVGSQRYSCYNCHASHGSATRPSLIVTGRNPGITSYTQTANGGTCTPTCHGSESYTVNYAR
ncbi:MAG TPA: cytochrome c3 family protein [Thermoanaerobaculia bacterium]|nr:cytochrome c3 family protein [Thermoanaerobaculia bacterium]